MVKRENQQPTAPKQLFYLPEYGKTVEADSLAEAVEIAKAQNDSHAKEGE